MLEMQIVYAIGGCLFGFALGWWFRSYFLQRGDE